MEIADDWWRDYANIVLLVQYMAEQPEYTKDDIAYAIEKPWKYIDVFAELMKKWSTYRDSTDPT